MADNVYLLETRLSGSQQAAISAVRDIARQHGYTVFLVGGAVRDLISGSPVRDLDIAVQGNALELRAALEQTGAVFSGQSDELQAVYLRFPGGVRIEVGSTLSVSYPKPSQPVYQPTSILEDLRRRDFTANAMALSLNDGSYGLLMDPLNGVADIENRELRLVSNYGFIEDPIRLVRAARLMSRLGWQMDERTRARYDTAKEEAYIDSLRPESRSYELEELFHEEDPLRVMRRLEEEGWLQKLSPSLSVTKANVAELGRLRDVQMQFQTRGVIADVAAANFALLTAKLAAKEVEEIRGTFPRAGFVDEIGALDSAAKELASRLLSKELSAPSAAYRFLMEASAATVVYAAYSSRSTALQNRLKSFLTEWPAAQGKIPYLLMQEMRITPDLPDYEDVVTQTMFAIMDGKLDSVEEARAFLEPFSPPAPPPPVSLRRPRPPRKEAKGKGKKKAVALAAEEGDDSLGETVVTSRENEVGADAQTSELPAVQGALTPSHDPKPVKVTAPKAMPAKEASASSSSSTPASSKKGAAAAATAASPKKAMAAKQPAAQGAKTLTRPAAPAVNAKPAGVKSKAEGKPKKATSPSRPSAKSAAPATKGAPGKQIPPPKKAATKKPVLKKSEAQSKKSATKAARRSPAKKAVAAKPARRSVKPTAPVKRAAPAKATKTVQRKGRR